ncbi:hypothetical protein [Labedaea rhizosphaerae]|uniref:hypothetical protein n=1 Tax=Labedaea rhizosphaerae TaxID=598644 RepID=UPI001414DAC7|nr:hypothetical protein [Labedaea rhizosphaerae]
MLLDARNTDISPEQAKQQLDQGLHVLDEEQPVPGLFKDGGKPIGHFLAVL